MYNPKRDAPEEFQYVRPTKVLKQQFLTIVNVNGFPSSQTEIESMASHGCAILSIQETKVNEQGQRRYVEEYVSYTDAMNNEFMGQATLIRKDLTSWEDTRFPKTDWFIHVRVTRVQRNNISSVCLLLMT